MRRVLLRISLGFAVGAALVLMLDPAVRKRLWEEVTRGTQALRKSADEYLKLLNQAIEAGKETAKLRREELIKGISSPKSEEESPDYIV